MNIFTKMTLPAVALASAFSTAPSYGVDPIKIGDTEIRISGYIKADLIASDVDSSAGGRFSFANQLVAPSFIPLEGTPAADQNDVTLHARQSRLVISTKNDRFKTKIEGDFFGEQGNERASNSNNFRVRVAWGEYGNWGFGQNWSAAVIFPSFVDQLSLSGFAGGYAPVRQPSVRYTNGGFVFALENPETTISSTAPGPTAVLQGTDRFPDIVTRYGVKGNYGAIQGALVVRGLSDTTGDLNETGVGAIVGGNLKLGPSDDIQFLLGHGALGRFMGDGAFADAEIVNGRLEALDITSGQIAYRHFWKKGVRSSISYSLARADNDRSFSGSNVNKEVSSIMTNLLWDLTPKTTVGVEVSQSKREVESGAEGELNRVQFSIQQKF